MSSHDGARQQTASGQDSQRPDGTLMVHSHHHQQQYEHFHQLRIQPRQPVYHPHRHHSLAIRHYKPNDNHHDGSRSQAANNEEPQMTGDTLMAESHQQQQHTHNHKRHGKIGKKNKKNKEKSKEKKFKQSGKEILNQLVRDLAKSTMPEDDEYSKPKYPAYYQAADGGRKSSRIARKAAREEKARHELMQMTSLEQQELKQKQRKLNEELRRKEKQASMIALSFDDQYLRRSNTGMNNDEIRHWIDSVYGHIESWYRDCLNVPENQQKLEAAQADNNAFTNSILREASTQHNAPKFLPSHFDESHLCPSASHLNLRASGGIDFIQHTALTACLIVRDGTRSGRFETCKSQPKLHITAAMLLVTVIMDLKVGFGYFYRHLHGTTTKTLQVPKALLSVAVDAFGELQRTSGCRITVHQGQLADLAYKVDFTGTAGQVDEGEQVVLKLMESTTVSERLSELASRVADCKMED